MEKFRAFQNVLAKLQGAAAGLKEKTQEAAVTAMRMTKLGLELLGKFEEEKQRHIQKTQKELPVTFLNQLRVAEVVDDL